eukprot:SAG31_NODE_3945_length_3729_cov_4.246832_5_plen_96_part_00
MSDDPDEFALLPPAVLVFPPVPEYGHPPPLTESAEAGAADPDGTAVAAPLVIGRAALALAAAGEGDPATVAAELRLLYERHAPRRVPDLPGLLEK